MKHLVEISPLSENSFNAILVKLKFHWRYLIIRNIVLLIIWSEMNFHSFSALTLHNTIGFQARGTNTVPPPPPTPPTPHLDFCLNI